MGTPMVCLVRDSGVNSLSITLDKCMSLLFMVTGV